MPAIRRLCLPPGRMVGKGVEKEMKMKKHSIQSLLPGTILYILILSLLLASCSEDEKTGSYEYFVSMEEEFTLQEVYINNILTNASLTYPELSDIIPYVGSGVDVYRFVYKTTLDGNEIDASGLLCLPSDPGEYPVLCFQNGTNTVDAYCPSNFANNLQYQLVEMLASTGFVVVIPDYPGFGESSTVTHPYLIAEPTVTSIVDMLLAVKEIGVNDLPGITLRDEYYLVGYSQGGWATMALHKALELDYADEFNLAASVCGAGPYDIKYLFESMINVTTYTMPVYIGYIVYAYSSYDQFTNPVTDLMNEPYASTLPLLYNGTNDFDEINSQLTTTLGDLLTPGFLSGFAADPSYSTVREAMTSNSIQAWHTLKPLLLIHGDADTDVNPLVTEHFYGEMIDAGTTAEICKKEILPDLDHGDAIIPAMIRGFNFVKTIEQGN